MGKGKLTSNSTLDSDANEGTSLSSPPTNQGVKGNAMDSASSSQANGSANKKPLPSSSPLILHNPAPSETQSQPPNDKETMDEEFLVDDRGGVISSSIQVKIEGT